MDFRLANGNIIVLDKDAVFRDPRAEGLAFLAALNGNGDGNKGEAMKGKDLVDYTDAELYDFKDRLKAQRPTGRGPDATHFRKVYKPTMFRCINAELRRRGLPKTRPGDCRVYGPGSAKWQQAGGLAK